MKEERGDTMRKGIEVGPHDTAPRRTKDDHRKKGADRKKVPNLEEVRRGRKGEKGGQRRSSAFLEKGYLIVFAAGNYTARSQLQKWGNLGKGTNG